jgi:TPR repeat protein
MAVKVLSAASKLVSARGVMIRTMWRRTFIFTCAFALSICVVPGLAADPLAAIEKSVQLIDRGENSLARAYLAPALINPRISAMARSRAYYLRGFSFASEGMPVSALRDFNRALEFYPANPMALFALARLYWDGVGVDQDDGLALSLFARAGELGHQDADLFLALGHLYGRGIDQDISLARGLLTDLAKNGDALAMSHLARSMRASSEGAVQAADWYRKAFAAGDPNAFLALAYMYIGGELSAPQPMSEANRLLRRAAAAGSAGAMVRLGHHYLSGTGVSKDYAESYALFLQASALGNADADVGLGYLHQAELVASSPDRSAGYWYQRAARAGNVEGQLRWARMLLNQQQGLKARSWFAAAARQNSVAGHNSLAWLLATCSDARLRDGPRALVHAQLAVDAQPSAGHLDTLAAAYAETGQFAQAVSTQRQALAALATSDAGLRDELEHRMQSYRQAQVWRE